MSTNSNDQTAVEPLLISVRDVATMLGISVRSVWRLQNTGQIVAPIRVGGAVRWRRDEVRRWIDEGCPRPPVATRKPR